MPAVLTDTGLCDPHVPAVWRGVLEDLKSFVELERQLHAGKSPHDEADTAELVAVHDRLVERSGALLEPAALDDLSRAELDRLFCRSALILVRLKQCVAAERQVLDTAGSRTLSLYEADFYDTPQNVQALLDRLRDASGRSDVPLDELAAEVEADLSDARRKQAVVEALRAEFGLRADADDLPKRVHAFFQSIYSDAPLVADEVALVMTGTLAFFCLPLTKDATGLTSARYEGLTADGKRPIQEFLLKVKRFTQDRFAHFPAFGFVDRTLVDRGLLARLSERAGLTPDDVLREIPQLITILPWGEIEKYLIHDVWGHGWQASILRFDDLYAQMAEFAGPLELSQSVTTADDQPLHLADCFRGRGERLMLDCEAFGEFAKRLVAQRLPIALSAVLAEVMADVAEYKFLDMHPEKSHWLPSSSRLYVYPAMLDLTLRDVPFYFGQATKVFRLWAASNKRQQRTRDQLIEQFEAPADVAGRAVEDAVAVWRNLESDLLRAELAWADSGDGQLRTNVFTRVMLNFVGVHRAVLKAYEELGRAHPGNLPLKSYKDLLVIGASVFFEADPARNLWRVDEYLSLEFLPQCRRL